MAEGGENSGHNTYPFYNGLYTPVDTVEEASGSATTERIASSSSSSSPLSTTSTLSSSSTVTTTTTTTTVEVQVQLIPDDKNIHENHLNNHINNIPSCSMGYSTTPTTNHFVEVTTTNATNSDINIPKNNQHFNKTHNSNNSNSSNSNKNNNNNNFKCILCNLNFQKKLNYVLHVRQHHLGSEKYRCDLCVKVCTSYPALLRHKIMSHTSGKGCT